MNKVLSQLDLNQIQQNAFPQSTLELGAKTSVGDIVSMAIPWIFTIAGMVLLVYLIFGGLSMMMSRGDPKQVEGAKSHITNALIGFIIIFIAYWVVQLFGLVLGLNGPLGITNVFK